MNSTLPAPAQSLARLSLDIPVAALAGLSVAFTVFILPADALADLIGATGLPQILPAAQPPLGNTARIGLAVAGALVVFATFYLLLRSLDRKPARPARTPSSAPRIRRRDRHPDAPAPRPINATLEFGEPDSAPSETEAPFPAWLSPAELDDSPVAEAPWSPPLPEVMAPAEPEPTPPVEPEPVRNVEVDRQPLFVERRSANGQGPKPAVERRMTTREKLRALDRLIANSPDPEEAPDRGETIGELMARLEQGLSRRQPEPADIRRSEPAATAGSAPRHQAGDDRLQSAIDSLQKLAARQA